MTSRPHLYQTLADSLIQSMRAGRYRPGDRLPSVRELCSTHGMSLATVTHALHRLEDAGWIASRPRRGFFVQAPRDGLPQQARRSTAATLQLEERRHRLMTLAASREGQVSLGHLALPPALLPLTALRRLMSKHLRTEACALASGSVFGSQALREQLAKRLARSGAAVSADDVILTHGDGESLQLCLGLLTQPGDRVAVASPGSLRVLEVVAALGLQSVELPISPGVEESNAALEAFLARERLAACVIDVSLFAAAAGTMSDAEKQSLVTLLAAHRVPLIEFDLMGELHHGAEKGRPLKAFDSEGLVIHCASLACVTGPGFSVGFVVSERHRLRLRAARTVHGELIPHMTDQVLAEFLSGDGFDAHLRRLRLRLRQQVAAWTRAVKQYFPTGTRVSTGDAGYVLWVELPAGLVASDLLARARDAGYTFVPGAVFTSTERFDHCLRLAAAHPLDAVRLAGLQFLGEAARQSLAPVSARMSSN
ncbi:DNA-binding transcriptional MocR family regulator [Pelomonas saccharophila]|uniref:DNA-binding transcriptional MocR family regulator n=1 Tax=Roseateles saccharophilus TaxID=304 RepID=A0ABU1YLX2_ROSSA|nr:PLP-dependent aminotransferase family protein [Roseateles saccharophilus]MDR7269850.1 DNA-binding transcriptional MocR family regulator [Roseateles saccharophilus]